MTVSSTPVPALPPQPAAACDAVAVPAFSDVRRARPALSLRTNFSWTFAGNLVYAGCQWAILVVLAKLGSPEIVGQFALGLAVTAPVFMLTNLQLRGVLATDAKEDYEFGEYLRLRIVTTIVAVLAVCGIVMLSPYRRETAMVILAVAAAKALESISDIAYGSLQHQERMDRISHSMMLRGVAGIALLWAGVRFTGSVFVGALGLATAWGVVLLAYDLPGRPWVASRTGLASIHRPIARVNRQRLWRLAVVAAPLGVVMMLLSLNVNIPRYVIQHHFGERALGIFAAVAYLMVAGTAVVGALGQSASPRLAQYYAQGRIRQFETLMRKLLLVGAAVGAAGILVAVVFGRVVLRVLFRPEYAASADVLTWMMGAAALTYLASFLGYGLTAARRFRVQAPLFTAVCVVVAASSFALVPSYGLAGAAWASTLGAAVQLIGSGLVLVRALHAAPAGSRP